MGCAYLARPATANSSAGPFFSGEPSLGLATRTNTGRAPVLQVFRRTLSYLTGKHSVSAEPLGGRLRCKDLVQARVQPLLGQICKVQRNLTCHLVLHVLR
jgi:hypothetical protein